MPHGSGPDRPQVPRKQREKTKRKEKRPGTPLTEPSGSQLWKLVFLNVRASETKQGERMTPLEWTTGGSNHTTKYLGTSFHTCVGKSTIQDISKKTIALTYSTHGEIFSSFPYLVDVRLYSNCVGLCGKYLLCPSIRITLLIGRYNRLPR